MKSIIKCIGIGLVIVGCAGYTETNQQEKWKEEIKKVEADFCTMAQTEGISSAFRAFAADDAVVLRNQKLYIGLDAIKVLYKIEGQNSNIQLTWKPDFVDVSSSGDLGYTYGQYVFSRIDSVGQIIKSDTGVFHSVWKRQTDGQWKFVWD